MTRFHLSPRALIVLALIVLSIPLLTACTTVVPKQDLLTEAESSGFKETTRYHRVMQILYLLEKQSPFLRVETYGETAEGRAMPLAVMGDPLPRTPKAAHASGRTVVFINANIHAGEVAGKEACLMLIRDLLSGDPLSGDTLSDDAYSGDALSGYPGRLLKNTVVLVAPIYNIDGNERIDPTHRYRQNGPERGVGIRSNAQHLDLNRDMMKLETPEARAMTENILSRWKPHVVVDCHTTNGSYHREPITYAPAHTPLADNELMHFNQDVMLPWIDSRTEKKHGYEAIPYGNFRDPMKPELGWYTFDHKPRYVSNYICLRNRLSILVEMYAYAEFETRILACRAFLQSILEFCDEEGAKVRDVVARAEQNTIEAAAPGGTPLRFHTEFEQIACDAPIVIHGFRMEMRADENGRKRPHPFLDEPRDYTVPYFGRFRPVDEGTPLPDSYFFPRALIEVRDKLERHGIEVEEIEKPFSIELEVFHIEKIDFENNLYQGHRLQRLSGKWEARPYSFPSGAFRVTSRQPLARLAAYLLEPESDDGLACWNGLDRYLTRGPWDSRPGEYPIMKWYDKRK